MAQTSIFGIPYASIQMLATTSMWAAQNIDVGSFADDGEDPPVYWTGTLSQGEFNIGGTMASIIGAVGLNPNPPAPPSGN